MQTCLAVQVRRAAGQDRVPEELPALLNEACLEEKLSFLEEEGRLEMLEPLSPTDQLNRTLANCIRRYALWRATGIWPER